MPKRPPKPIGSTPWDLGVVEKTYPNQFLHQTSAERYHRARPYFHPVVVEKIREHLQIEGPVASALDVGCGTGQSSVALRAIACLLYTSPSPRDS